MRARICRGRRCWRSRTRPECAYCVPSLSIEERECARYAKAPRSVNTRGRNVWRAVANIARRAVTIRGLRVGRPTHQCHRRRARSPKGQPQEGGSSPSGEGLARWHPERSAVAAPTRARRAGCSRGAHPRTTPASRLSGSHQRPAGRWCRHRPPPQLGGPSCELPSG
jgi:hypothetical protein